MSGARGILAWRAGAQRALLRRLARVFGGPAGKRRETTFGDWVAELRDLGLAADYLRWSDYRAALEGALGMTIEIGTIEDLRHPLVTKKLRSAGILGGLVYLADARTAWILVPRSLAEDGGLEWERLLFHELSHLAAGHHLPANRVVRLGESGDARSSGEHPVQAPWRGIAEWQPPGDDAARELDVARRTAWCMDYAFFGPQVFASTERFFAVDSASKAS